MRLLSPKARLSLLFAVSLSVGLFMAFSPSSKKYPKEFVWGAAFSAHQAEGVFGGGEAGDWYQFEHPLAGQVSPIAGGDHADLAVDHWHRYAEDLALAKSLGLDTVRTSLAWEKIEPKPGQFNEAALAHYRDVLLEMHRLGLKPMVAFQHFTHPRWFHEQGGWLSPESPKIFLRYAERVFQALGDQCDLWITLNEPMVLAVMGYDTGEMPPNLKSPEQAFLAAYNMARAHRMVYAMLHRLQKIRGNARGSDGRLAGVGAVHSLTVYDPADPANPKDRKAAEAVSEWMNWGMIRAIETGIAYFSYPYGGSIKTFDRLMPVDDLRPSERQGPFSDWLGVNYYSRGIVRRSQDDRHPIERIKPPEMPGDNGWAIYPEGMEQILRQTAERFHLPLVLSENGMADSNDSKRPDFIRNHLAALDRAYFGGPLGAPLDLRGYYHWSLFDNFEWLHGYKYRFGLFEVLYDQDLKRVPRGSAGVYQREIERRRE